MSSIVIYNSNTGFTKKYAQWIAETLSCEAVSIENIKKLDLASYDTIVFGGWFFAGNVQGLKAFKSCLKSFKGKLAFFAVGSMAVNAPTLEDTMNKAFTEEDRKNNGVFYMQGGLDYDNMGFVHKSMMKMMCNMMKKEKGIDSVEYQSISKSFDATDKASIKPILDYILK